MNRAAIEQVLNILENQYWRGGEVAKEAKQIILLLLGQEHGGELLRLWGNLINNQ